MNWGKKRLCQNRFLYDMLGRKNVVTAVSSRGQHKKETFGHGRMTKLRLLLNGWYLSLPNPCISWSLAQASRCLLQSLSADFQQQVELFGV